MMEPDGADGADAECAPTDWSCVPLGAAPPLPPPIAAGRRTPMRSARSGERAEPSVAEGALDRGAQCRREGRARRLLRRLRSSLRGAIPAAEAAGVGRAAVANAGPVQRRQGRKCIQTGPFCGAGCGPLVVRAKISAAHTIQTLYVHSRSAAGIRASHHRSGMLRAREACAQRVLRV